MGMINAGIFGVFIWDCNLMGLRISPGAHLSTWLATGQIPLQVCISLLPGLAARGKENMRKEAFAIAKCRSLSLNGSKLRAVWDELG